MILNLKRLTGAIVTAVAVGLPSFASAGTINMIVGNLDVQFSGAMERLIEVDDPDFGSLDPDNNDAQPVSSTEFTSTNPAVNIMLMDPPSDLFIDLLVDNMPSTLTFGSLQTVSGVDGKLNWFNRAGESLLLTFDEISYTAVNFPAFGLGLFSFFAEGTVVAQNLPGGLQYSQDVLISYTSTDAVFTRGGGIGAAMDGALTVSGQMAIPEPSSICLVGLMLTGGSAMALRRRLG